VGKAAVWTDFCCIHPSNYHASLLLRLNRADEHLSGNPFSPSVLKCRGWQPAHPRPSAVISQAKEEHVKVSLAQLSAGAGVDFKLQSESCRCQNVHLLAGSEEIYYTTCVFWSICHLPNQTYSQAAVFSQYPGLHVAHWLSADRSSCFLQLAQASPMPTSQVIGMHSSLSDRT